MSGLVWVEIDGTAPEHNLRQIRNGSAHGVLTCAVIKANAYGHGVARSPPCFPPRNGSESTRWRRGWSCAPSDQPACAPPGTRSACGARCGP